MPRVGSGSSGVRFRGGAARKLSGGLSGPGRFVHKFLRDVTSADLMDDRDTFAGAARTRWVGEEIGSVLLERQVPDLATLISP